MSIRESDTAVMAPVLDTLAALRDHGRDLRPPDVDPEVWSRAVLYDLARAVELLHGIVEQVSGRGNDAVDRRAHALATVIAAHRNVQLGPPPPAAEPTRP